MRSTLRLAACSTPDALACRAETRVFRSVGSGNRWIASRHASATRMALASTAAYAAAGGRRSVQAGWLRCTMMTLATKPRDETEQAWISRARSGDTEAFALLMRQYQDRLFSFLLRWLQNRAAAEDVLQLTLLRVFRSLERFREGEPFRPWLYRVAVNETKAFLRTENRAERRKRRVAEGTSDSGLEVRHGRLDAIAALEQGLSTLSSSDRQLLILRFVEELELSEIVEVVGAPRVVVKMRISRARARFRAAVRALEQGGS